MPFSHEFLGTADHEDAVQTRASVELPARILKDTEPSQSCQDQVWCDETIMHNRQPKGNLRPLAYWNAFQWSWNLKQL